VRPSRPLRWLAAPLAGMYRCVSLAARGRGRGQRELNAAVADNGVGGAAEGGGTGLTGIERRMAAFGGRLKIGSPSGGPTQITVAVPCAS